MNRFLGALTASALVSTLGVAVPSASLAAATDPWGGPATFPTNRVVMTSAYADGTWSYTDRWGDGQGANADGLHREDYYAEVPEFSDDLTYDLFGAHRTAHNGDYLLPWDDARWPELSADAVFVQLRRVDGGTDLRIAFAAMGAPDATVVTLGIDVDGARESDDTFPANAGVTCGSCGIDRFVTLWGAGGDVTDADGTSLGEPTVRADTDGDTITAHIPDGLLGAVDEGGTWRLWGVAGVHDGSGGYTTVLPVQTVTDPGGGTGTGANVFDLLFDTEDRARVDDLVQADLLVDGDIAPASVDVDLAALRAGVTRTEGEPTSGPVERVLVSSIAPGDGIDNGQTAASYQFPEPVSVYRYLGRLQPYLVHLPAGYDPGRRWPVVVALHGYTGSYDEIHFLASGLADQADEHGYVLVYPLGRGDIQYEGMSELDVLEVLRDVEDTYSIDPARRHVIGLSMGGYGTSKMSIRHPDLFATATPFLGVADQDYLANTVNTPSFVVTANADLDPGGVQGRMYHDALVERGFPTQLKHYDLRSHEWQALVFAYDDLFAFWDAHRVPTAPARVTYDFEPSWSAPDLGLVDDGAYWIDGLVSRDGARARVDADALTIPLATTELEFSSETGGDAADRSSFTLERAVAVPTGERAQEHGLDLTATNLAEVTADLGRLQVDPSRPYCIHATSDGATTLTLTGVDWAGAKVRGAPGETTGSGAAVDLPAGASEVTIVPADAAADAASDCALPAPGAVAGPGVRATPLPTTGAGAVPAALLALGGAALLTRRRSRVR